VVLITLRRPDGMVEVHSKTMSSIYGHGRRARRASPRTCNDPSLAHQPGNAQTLASAPWAPCYWHDIGTSPALREEETRS
jgi:hypothetical protein